ncbi:hypothetical protein OG535_30385 [Kitasatospora sp. NBC_00085]|uniref:hypothetical protein n=1 Tax=unclassified Kitasatospora TaxID=2633591 RepID=UPI00324AEE26
MTARTILQRLHGRPAEDAPRWAVRTAYLVSLLVLPSCLWRIAGVDLRVPLMEPGPDAPAAPELFGGEWWYVIGMSLFSEAVAFLAVGLVSRWGEVWPRWIPRLGGLRVPPLAAVIPAGLGAAALMIFPYALAMMASGRKIDGSTDAGLITHGWQTVTFWAAYLPLAAWGPLLGILTVHYYRRRAARPAA